MRAVEARSRNVFWHVARFRTYASVHRRPKGASQSSLVGVAYCSCCEGSWGNGAQNRLQDCGAGRGLMGWACPLLSLRVVLDLVWRPVFPYVELRTSTSYQSTNVCCCSPPYPAVRWTATRRPRHSSAKTAASHQQPRDGAWPTQLRRSPCHLDLAAICCESVPMLCFALRIMPRQA